MINAIITVTQIYLCKLIDKIIPLFGMIDKVTGAQDYLPSPTIENGPRRLTVITGFLCCSLMSGLGDN